MAERQQGKQDHVGTVGPQRDESDEPKVKGAVKGEEVKGGRQDGQVTKTAPKEADQSSYPTANDAEPEDPPVRAAKPTTPVAVALASGAGEHQPPDPDEFRPDGRPKGDDE